jgi:hypothetical protein
MRLSRTSTDRRVEMRDFLGSEAVQRAARLRRAGRGKRERSPQQEAMTVPASAPAPAPAPEELIAELTFYTKDDGNRRARITVAGCAKVMDISHSGGMEIAIDQNLAKWDLVRLTSFHLRGEGKLVADLDHVPNGGRSV